MRQQALSLSMHQLSGSRRHSSACGMHVTAHLQRCIRAQHASTEPQPPQLWLQLHPEGLQTTMAHMFWFPNLSPLKDTEAPCVNVSFRSGARESSRDNGTSLCHKGRENPKAERRQSKGTQKPALRDLQGHAGQSAHQKE